LTSLDLNQEKYSIGWNEKKISNVVEEYKYIDNRLNLLYGLEQFVKILIKLYTINNKNYIIIYDDFENLYEYISNLNSLRTNEFEKNTIITQSMNYTEKITNNYYNFRVWLKNYSDIVCDRIDYYNPEQLFDLFLNIHNIYWEKPYLKENENYFCYNDECYFEFSPKIYIKKIIGIYKFIRNKKNLLEQYEKEIKLLINKYINFVPSENKNLLVYKDKKLIEKDVVIKKLFKLYYPIKQPHYEYIYHNIIYNTDTIINTKPNIVVESENQIKSTIFKNSKNEIPTMWIKTYAPNIGKEEKTDLLHMFPFVLDELLANFPCIKIENTCQINGWTNYMYYFNGVLEYKDTIKTGCYEYFINSNGTLFHRMFRPWSSIPDNIKSMIEH
jgi:hypothetical protein